MAINSKVLESYLNSLLIDKNINEKNNLLNQVKDFSSSVLSNQNIWLFLNSPLMGTEEKRSFLSNFAEKLKVDQIIINFFSLLIKNKRLDLISLLPAITNKYLDEINGVINISVLSSVEFDADSKSNLKKKLSTIGMNNINLSYKVDDSLLSGFKLITDSKVYDLSLKSVLNQFQEQLRVTTLNTDETNKLKSENVEVS